MKFTLKGLLCKCVFADPDSVEYAFENSKFALG